MPKLSYYQITNTLDTDKLNKNFKNIIEDITLAYSRLNRLQILYDNQITNMNAINAYRSHILQMVNTIEHARSKYQSNDLNMLYVDVNTAESTIYTSTEVKYGNVALLPRSTFDRLPATTDTYGEKIPLYNAITVKLNGEEVSSTHDVYNSIVNDPRKVYIVESSDPITYEIKSLVSVPNINSIELVPVFGGIQNIKYLSYGTSSSLINIKDGNFSNLYGREFIFKQSQNADTFSFEAEPVSLSTGHFIGFYKIAASYKLYPSSGSLIMTKTLGTGAKIRSLKLFYDYFGSIADYKNIIYKLFTIRIYDSSTRDEATKIYDSDIHLYPYISTYTPIELTDPAGEISIEIIFNRYEDISPMFNYLLLGVEL